MSPRRSSRAARTSQPATNQPHTNPPAPSSSSRQDRTARPLPQHNSASKSPSPQSSSDGADHPNNPSTLESRPIRRNARQHEAEPEEAEMAPNDVLDEEGDEEEVTRCVCRRLEYPGPPVPLNEGNRLKDAGSTIASSLEGLPDDAGSLFIQCDICKVWQHGGCVGIMDEETSPENYFCEECRSDFHKIMTGARGQRYSRYLPLYEPVEPAEVKPPKKLTTPKESEKHSSKEPETKAGALSASMLSAKRRSTMNSRAAWQEEEELQRVLEASKTEGGTSVSASGHRKGKRNREESEETRRDLKRRKTGSSGSSDTPPIANTVLLEGDSDNEGTNGRSTGPSKRSRARVAEGRRDKDTRDKEREREREKAEAAGRRKGRAERRHAEESEPPESEKMPSASVRAATNANKFAKPQAFTRVPLGPPPVTAPATTSHKKNGRPPARRGRVGRNQYTRDRDTVTDGKAESPRVSRSHDGDDGGNGVGDAHTGNTLPNGSKPSKPRHMNPNRTSMNDLRKRAAGIMEFISRTQVDMAGEQTQPVVQPPLLPPPPRRGAPARIGLLRVGSDLTASKLSQEIDAGEDEGDEAKKKRRKENSKSSSNSIINNNNTAVEEAAFKAMNSLQMMDVLTRELVMWQKEHGKWGER